MKKLFKEPDIEILTFLCNQGVEGFSDAYDRGGEGEEVILPE